MKKLVTLLAAAGMVVAASAPANAVDVKVSGFHAFTFETQQQGFTGQNLENALQRTRLGLNFVASENLSGFLQFQMGTNEWGSYVDAQTEKGNKQGRVDVQTRQAYVDWIVPGTSVKVRMGRQQVGLPGEAFGDSSVMSAGWGGRDGIAVSAPVTDWLALNALWVRAGVDGNSDLDEGHSSDVFGLAAPMKFNGFAVTPWVAYGALDKEADDLTVAATGIDADADAYWAGVTATFTYFDPFTLKASFTYGSAEQQNGEKDIEGWNAQIKASYKTAFGTPVLGGWYFSGADEDGEGWMPNAGYFAGTNHYYDGFANLVNPHGNTNNDGTWAVQAGIEGVSFLSNLTHDFHVTYLEGTNDKDAPRGTFTEDDAMVEISLNNVYKIYKNLAIRLELAYIINDFSDAKQDAGQDEDDWFAGLTFDFRF